MVNPVEQQSKKRSKVFCIFYDFHSQKHSSMTVKGCESPLLAWKWRTSFVCFVRGDNISCRIIEYDSREFWELAFASHEYVFLPYRDIFTTATTRVQFSKMTSWNISGVELNDWFLISIPTASSPFTRPPSGMIGTHEESKCA